MAEWTSTISRACAGGGVAAMLAGQTFGGKPMDRRAFLAAGSTAALLPALAAGATPPAGATTPTPGLFTTVKFTTDGLSLSPREYVAVLQEIAAADDFEADDYSRGGALAALEARFAAALGKPAAIWLPTGTLANQLALRTLAGADRRVLVQADSHLYCDSGDGATTLAGLNLVPLGAGPEGITLDEVAYALSMAASGRVAVPVGAIAIESPIRRRDHAAVPFEQLQAITTLAREHGIRTHLDGSRLFTLPLHAGHGVREHAALFDTVYVSTWKHFNSASGAILAGETAVISPLFHARRMYGGGLPAAWPLAAPAARHLDSFEADYADAWRRMDAIIAALAPHRAFAFRKFERGTSRLFLRVDTPDPAAFAARVRTHDIHFPRGVNGDGEFVLQVNPTLARRPVEALVAVMVAALG